MYRKFIQKVISYLFRTPSNILKIFIYFSVFSECYPGFSDFYIFAKFLPSFLKTITKLFCIPKFRQKLQNTNFAIFIYSTFKISSQLIIIRSYTLMSAKSIQETQKFSQNFLKIFQQPHQLISKCLTASFTYRVNPGLKH